MEESDKHKPVSAVKGALGKKESSGYSRSVKLPVFGEIPLTIVLILAFMVSNLVSYITNRIFVFTPSGRSKLAEFGIFLLVSSISFYAGNVAKNWFIDAGLHKDLAVLSFAIASVLVNFITRKYIVFSDKKFTEEGSVPVS